jgi:hypothetical protein
LEIRRRIARNIRQLLPWIPHHTITQLGSLLRFVLPKWRVALDDFGADAHECFGEASELVDAAATVQFPGATDSRFVSSQVAELFMHAAITMEASSTAWSTLKKALKRFKKHGSTFGQMSKTQKEKGFVAPLPNTPPPEVEGIPLFSIVGPIPAVPALSDSTVNGRTASTPGRGGDGGQLYRALSRYFDDAHTSTSGACLACLYLGESAGGHNLNQCARFSKAWERAVADGVFTPGANSNARPARFGYQPPRRGWGPRRRYSPDRDGGRDSRYSDTRRDDTGRGDSSRRSRDDNRGSDRDAARKDDDRSRDRKP